MILSRGKTLSRTFDACAALFMLPRARADSWPLCGLQALPDIFGERLAAAT